MFTFINELDQVPISRIWREGNKRARWGAGLGRCRDEEYGLDM